MLCLLFEKSQARAIFWIVDEDKSFYELRIFGYGFFGIVRKRHAFYAFLKRHAVLTPAPSFVFFVHKPGMHIENRIYINVAGAFAVFILLEKWR